MIVIIKMTTMIMVSININIIVIIIMTVILIKISATTFLGSFLCSVEHVTVWRGLLCETDLYTCIHNQIQQISQHSLRIQEPVKLFLYSP